MCLRQLITGGGVVCGGEEGGPRKARKRGGCVGVRGVRERELEAPATLGDSGGSFQLAAGGCRIAERDGCGCSFLLAIQCFELKMLKGSRKSHG